MSDVAFSIPLIVFTLVAYSGIGLALGARAPMSAGLLGVSLPGAVGGALAVVAVGAIRMTFIALLIVGLVCWFRWLRTKSWKYVLTAECRSVAASYFVGFVVAAIIFRKLEAHFYFFEPHDVLYFAPSLEMLIGDYYEPMRLFTYYPNQMAAFHFLPSAVAASLSLLVPGPNLATAIEARYVFLVFAFGCFMARLLISAKEQNRIGVLLLTLSALMLYGEQINYSAHISSYYYVALLIAIAGFFIPGAQESDTVKALFWVFLTIAKAPIFFVAGGCALFVVWHKRASIRWSVLAPIAVLALLNIVSWKALPPPFSNRETSFLPLNPFDFQMFRNNVKELADWQTLNPIVRLADMVPLQWLRALIDLIYTLLGVYVVAVALVFSASRRAQYASGRRWWDPRALDNDGRVLLLYLALSIFAWTFMRTGGSIQHMAHAFLLAAVLDGALLSIVLIFHVDSRWRFFAVIPALLFMNPYCVGCVPNYHTAYFREYSGSTTTLRLGDVGDAMSTESNRYIPKAGERMGQAELRSALRGQRLYAKDAPDLPHGLEGWYLKPSGQAPDGR